MRRAASGAWRPPASGRIRSRSWAYLLGAAILILAAAVFFNVKLPLITSQQQAFVIIVVLMGAKIVDSVGHSLLNRS